MWETKDRILSFCFRRCKSLFSYSVGVVNRSVRQDCPGLDSTGGKILNWKFPWMVKILFLYRNDSACRGCRNRRKNEFCIYRGMFRLKISILFVKWKAESKRGNRVWEKQLSDIFSEKIERFVSLFKENTYICRLKTDQKK